MINQREEKHVSSFGTNVSLIRLILSTISNPLCDSSQQGRLLSPPSARWPICILLLLEGSSLVAPLLCYVFFSSLSLIQSQESRHSSCLWNVRKNLHDLQTFLANVARRRTPRRALISVAVIGSLSPSSREKHGCLEKATASFGPGSHRCFTPLAFFFFFFLKLLKPSCERCCRNQVWNKHAINLFAYQLSEEPWGQQSCPCS